MYGRHSEDIKSAVKIDLFLANDEYWTETWANYLSKQYFGERWFGMEIKIKGHLDFYYPSKNVSRSFLFKKSLLPF